MRRGEALLVVNAAPIEVVEYALSSGRKLRTLVPADSSLVSAPGERYHFEKRQAPGVRLRRRHFPRVRYAELLENNRLLVVSVFPWQDYPMRPDDLVLDSPSTTSSVACGMSTTWAEASCSRTETDRAYVPFERASDGTILGMYFTRLDESVVVKLRFQPE